MIKTMKWIMVVAFFPFGYAFFYGFLPLFLQAKGTIRKWILATIGASLLILQFTWVCLFYFVMILFFGK